MKKYLFIILALLVIGCTVSYLPQSNTKLEKSTESFGFYDLDIFETWKPKEGVYIISTYKDIRLQIFDGTQWYPIIPQAGASFEGILDTDGIHYRFYNAGRYKTRVYYRIK